MLLRPPSQAMGSPSGGHPPHTGPRFFLGPAASGATFMDLDEDELFEEQPVSDEEIVEILQESPWLRPVHWHGTGVCRSSSMGIVLFEW